MVKSHVPAHGVQGELTSSLRIWIALLLAITLVPASGERGASPLVNTQPRVTPVADSLTLEWHTPPARIVRHTDGAIWVEMPGYL